MKERGAHLRQYCGIWLLTGLLITLSFAVVLGQSDDPYRAKGKVIAEGKNRTPVGPLNLKTYRIEEIRFSSPTSVVVNGRSTQVDRAYKVTITGESFPVRDLPATIWIGDTRIGVAQENEDLTEVTAVIYDRSLLRDGATVSFSFGEKESYTQLPEKLNLNGHR